MSRIGRPRKAEALQKQNISVNIRKTLLSRLNNELSYNSSRSVWIENAIEAKLDAHENEYQIINELSSKRLITILLNRQVISLGMWETLVKVIDAGDIK